MEKTIHEEIAAIVRECAPIRLKRLSDPKEIKKPYPIIDINSSFDIGAFDSDGRLIARITTAKHGAACNTSNSIEAAGYNSDFAEWDADGRFVRLKDGFTI